jgi:hypothetical protein
VREEIIGEHAPAIRRLQIVTIGWMTVELLVASILEFKPGA